MDERPLINEDGDIDLDQFDPLDDIPWPPPCLSAIDLPLALHANIKARATVPKGTTQYNRLPRDQPHRPFQLCLPERFNRSQPNLGPIDFFKLFFTDEIIDVLVQNTNLYAQSAKALVGCIGTGRYWTPVNRHDISIYLALTIHIGLTRNENIESYWDFTGLTYHRPMSAMSHFRYTQIKKYFHVSMPTSEPLPENQWFIKLSPLFEHLRTKFKEFCIPSQNVSVDEMMEAFTGRSKHSLKMPNKPIGEGFKSWALCDHGYTWHFLFYSRVCGTAELEMGTHLSPTASAVLQLSKTLPYTTYQFSLFCDNLFSKVELFSQLREIGIGACRTTRKDVTDEAFGEGTIERWKAEWGTLWSKIAGTINKSGMKVPGVLVSVWQDQAIVKFCSTIHRGTEWVVRERKKTKNTSSASAITKAPFIAFDGKMAPDRKKKNQEYVHRRYLPIPRMVDEYNHFMNGVDIADQLRAKFSTQQRTARSWMPLFYQLLDTAIVNAYILSEYWRKAQLAHPKMEKSAAASRTIGLPINAAVSNPCFSRPFPIVKTGVVELQLDEIGRSEPTVVTRTGGKYASS